MLELTKKPRTDGSVEYCVVLPPEQGQAFEELMLNEFGKRYSVEEVFPDRSPGRILRGARGIREMTQKQLAGLVSVSVQYISDLEHDRRAISKDMARKLGEALNFDYRVFL